MSITRRQAMSMSALAALSVGTLTREDLEAQAAQAQPPWPDRSWSGPCATAFPAPLPLNADGSAPEHPASEAGPITTPLMWKTANRQAPAIEFDYQKMAIKVDTRGLARRRGHDAFRRPGETAAGVSHVSAAMRRAESARHREMDRRPLQRFRGHAGSHPWRALLPSRSRPTATTSTRTSPRSGIRR